MALAGQIKLTKIKNTMRKFIVIEIFLLAFLASCQRPASLWVLTGGTMGTTYSVKVVRDRQFVNPLTEASLKNGIDQCLMQVNQWMSTYLDDSEISRFNKYRGTDWFPVSYPLVQVFSEAIEISKKSNGAFDITVGPLVNLWGFGPEYRPTLIPSEPEIQERKARVGYERLSIQPDPPAVKKSIPELYCDLSAIAKGFGVDQVAHYLDSLAIRNYMVEIGGEIRVKGVNQNGKKWQIGIAAPDTGFGIKKIIGLTNLSVATSGDYRNYFEYNGVRYSHTIDPATGRPITHKLASVTVIQPNCMLADGWATAIDVLGPEKGYELASAEELPVLLIVRKDGEFIEKKTPEFEKIIAETGNRN